MLKHKAKELIIKLGSDTRFRYLEKYEVTHILAIPEGIDAFDKWIKLYLVNEGNEDFVFSRLPDDKTLKVYLVAEVDGFLFHEDLQNLVKEKGIIDYNEYLESQ